VCVLGLLASEPEERTRSRVRTELWDRPTKEVLTEAGNWLKAQDKADQDFEHHKLEVLWLHQANDAVNAPLLGEVLRSPDYRARAAATRVLCYWRDRMEKPLDLLRTQVNDEHPRVRLEAVRALSFFNTQEAIDVTVESLLHDQDDYLTYTLKETMNTLERRVKAGK
jgi:HEAT repeat protein